MRTRVKICGITRSQDAVAAARAGADAIGLVFYPPSPRNIDIGQARQICDALPPFVSKVALFVNAEAELIREVCDAMPIDIIQFHGNECPDYCQQHGLPYIKAIRMREETDLHKEREHYAVASALLVDAYKAGVPGGTGESFDWSLIPDDLAGEIILAGGLTPDNVSDAITQVHPWAVDVSGGVEESPGVKSHKAIESFMQGVEVAKQYYKQTD